MPPLPWLVVDIGGTNIRLGRILEPGGAVEDLVRVPTPRTDELTPVLDEYLAQFLDDRPHAACVALAGPVGADIVHLTNSAAYLETTELAQRLELDSVLFANDLEAVATALPSLSARQVRSLGFEMAGPGNGTRLVLGCGTGCGVGAAMWTGDGWHVAASEGGHLPFLAETERDRRWRDEVARRLPSEAEGRVTYDRIICGSGLAWLARVIEDETGVDAPETPEAIVEAARLEENITAMAVADHFACTVTSFAGDLGQVFLARGGVYLTGSLLESLEAYLLRRQAREAYKRKWPHEKMLATFPLRLIVDPVVPLSGLGKILARSGP